MIEPINTTATHRARPFLDRGALLQSIRYDEGRSSNCILPCGDDEGKDDDSSVSADPRGSISTEDVESSTGNSTRGGPSTQDYEVELERNILREDEKNVRRARLLVSVSFLACAATITCVVYFLTKQSDQSAFETQVGLLLRQMATATTSSLPTH